MALGGGTCVEKPAAIPAAFYRVAPAGAAGQYVTVMVTEPANAPGARDCAPALWPWTARGWKDPPPVPATGSAPAVFGVDAVALGDGLSPRLTLYGVGLVQVTETEDVALAPAAMRVANAEAGAETWQEDTTVTVTGNEAVRVAARAGVEARPETRKPKTKAKDAYFMDSASFVTKGNIIVDGLCLFRHQGKYLK